MTILFMGGEMGAYIPSDSSVFERTQSNTYDSTFSRSSLGPQGGLAYAESATFAATDDLWVHFTVADGEGNGEGPTDVPLALAAGGANLFRVLWSSSGNTLQMQYWTGAAWANAGSSFPILINGVQHFDLHVDGNSATGACELYAAGTMRASASSVNLSAVAGITNVRHYGMSTASCPGITQVIVATTSTIGMRLFSVPVNGVGSDSAWIGSYLNIDENRYSDADFINSPTANQVSTFAANSPTLTGYQVLAVGVSARARCGASGPQNLQLALRSSGTNYFSSSKALGAGYGAYLNIWETDPATSAAWVNAAVSSLQPGVKSIT